MGNLYRFLFHLTSGFIIFLLYHKIIMFEKKKISVLEIVGMSLYALYMMLAHSVIIEPFRAAIGFIILLAFLFVKEKKVLVVGLLVPFLLFPIIRVIVGPIVTAVMYLLISQYAEFETVQFFILLPIEIITFILLYMKIKTEKLTKAITEKEIRTIIWLSTIIIWVIYGLVHTLGMLVNETAQIITMTLLTILIPSGFIAIFFVLYSVKKYHQRKELEEKMANIELVSSKLANKVLMVEQEKHELQLVKEKINEERLNLRAVTHKYNEHITTLATMSSRIVSGLNDKEAVDENILSSITNLKNIASELSEELIIEDFNATISLLDLPKEWEYLETMLANFMISASKDDIAINVISEVQDWMEVDINQTQISGLIKNLLSNAVRETIKSDSEIKLIEVRFLQDEYGLFSIEIVDHAHEFPVEILQKLGERGNSTNETGDGFAEVFEILDKIQGSLLFQELKVKITKTKWLQLNLMR